MKQIFYSIHCHPTFRYLLFMLLVMNYTIGFSQDNSSTTLRCGTPPELSEELAQQEAEFAAHQAAQRISARTSATGTALYVRFKFKGENDPPTVNLDEAKEFFEHSSYGQYTIEFTEVEQVIELPYTRETATDNSNYDFKDDVNEALLNMGYNHNDYDYYLNRSRGGKPVGGTNYSAGHYIQLISRDSWVTCHEIGHSLYKILGIDAFKSLNHANWWKPSAPGQVIGPGNSAEYADKSSIMGNNVGLYADLNFAHKVNLGWLSESEYHRVVDNDVYRIYAHDMNTKQSGRQYGIIVEKNTKALGTSEPEHKYYLEYKVDNPKTPDAYKNGVTMTAFEDNYTQLFDLTPGSADKQRDAPLQVGMSFRDEEAGITIETVEKGGSGSDSWIEVAVEFDNPPGKGAFEVPELAWQSPTPNQQFAEGDEIRLQVDIDGYAEEVWFFQGVGAPSSGAYSFLGEDGSEPFEWTVTEDLPPGNYRFGARAVNDVGKSKVIPIDVVINDGGSEPAVSEENENDLTVRARGITGNERLALRIENQLVATWSLSTSFANYTYRGDVAGKNLKVAYINDNQPAWDVVVDYLQMDDQVLQAEDQAVNTGAWENGSCGGSYSENMYCQGYIDFGSITTRLATSAAKETLSAKGSGSLVSYPNPSSGQVSFSRTVSLRLIDPVGQEVLSATQVTSLDVSNLPTGVYTIQFATGELNKLVVE